MAAPRHVLILPVCSTAQLDEPGSKDVIFQQEHKTQPTVSVGPDNVSISCRNMKSAELTSGNRCHSLYVNGYEYFYSTRYEDRPVAFLFLYRNMLRKSWDSSVSIVSRLRAGGSGVHIPAMTKLFLFSKCPFQLWSPFSLLFVGY